MLVVERFNKNLNKLFYRISIF